MFIPTEFHTIKQPPGSRVCGAAVCAMAIGKTLDEVLAEADWRQLTFTSGIAQYLAKHGITLGSWFQHADPADGPFDIGIDPTGHPAIVSVQSATFKDAEHWVFWDGHIYRDPSEREQQRYKVLETFYLTYWPDEPHWLGRLPADWNHPHNEVLLLEAPNA